MSREDMARQPRTRERLQDALSAGRATAESLSEGASALGQSVRSGALKVRENLPDMSSASKRKVATAAVAGAAAAGAALAAFLRHRRESGSSTVLHLEPRDGSEGWCLVAEGDSEAQASFATKAEGIDAGRSLARESAPSELVIYRSDGTEQARHSYSPRT